MLLPSRNLRSVFGQLLGVGVEIPYWRVSDEGIKRDSLYQQEPAVVIGGGLQVGHGGPGWAQIKAAVEDAPDFGNTAVLVDLIVSSVAKGRIFLRLIPDSIIAYPGGLLLTPNWEAAFARFSELLKNDGWQIKVAASTAVNPQLPISFLSFDSLTSELTVILFNQHTWLAGETVRIGGTQGSTGINGTYIITATPANNEFKVRLTTVPTLGTQPSGYARRLFPDFQIIGEAKAKRVTGRKAGRPFGTLVGRRPA